ncbi:sigma-54-dependent Fis family transcriptional regulator [Thalassotalea litorea]|uniref:Sigma-54-dependent Fis family transcriptional regulator n=1 Tax=Thalassotalea litorea TaxID=2020715 RepID=A0A5R9IUB5_9GAMM|nr:sigma-54 dependent transcriptional regulator [Thalassotalea litorea]TLU67697.1 sigma-54-dependent Fis family transcriptional regulator [Thalassotalea litorea]
MKQSLVLVVEDDPGLREAVVDTLMLSDYHCVEADSGESALLMLKQHAVDIVVTDVQMGGMSGLDLLRNIKHHYPELPVLIMTAYATIDDAVQAMKDGASNYMAKPFAPEVLVNMINQYIPDSIQLTDQPVAKDTKSVHLLSLARKVALSDASVMVLGPSGSGKEVLSQYIHNQSPRAEHPFIAINCAAIPENMLEATLFGYEKGAFTGAINACPGKFEQAQKGTILLDEITEMDLALQAKILRVIQERQVERLGGRKTISLDVRVIATSNRDLKQAVNEGIFREDLYYRLNVFPLTWPPLSERRDDILPLTEYLLRKFSPHHPVEISDSARHKLLSYDWPGNVRELDNIVQRALILNQDNVINADDLMIEEICVSDMQESMAPINVNVTTQSADLESGLKQQEFQIILDALDACNGSRKDVALRLGVSARTLRYKLAKMREHGIEFER